MGEPTPAVRRPRPPGSLVFSDPAAVRHVGNARRTDRTAAARAPELGIPNRFRPRPRRNAGEPPHDQPSTRTARPGHGEDHRPGRWTRPAAPTPHRRSPGPDRASRCGEGQPHPGPPSRAREHPSADRGPTSASCGSRPREPALGFPVHGRGRILRAHLCGSAAGRRPPHRRRVPRSREGMVRRSGRHADRASRDRQRCALPVRALPRRSHPTTRTVVPADP